MIIKRMSFLALALVLVFNSCDKEETKGSTAEVKEMIDHTTSKFAPDKRVVLFEVEPIDNEGKLALVGETTDPEALDYLRARLDKAAIEYQDSVKVLPSTSLKGRTGGIIQLSVANLRSKPSHSSELVTQATLGTPVKVFKKEEDWYYIQTPDGYLAWVDKGGVSLSTPEELNAWRGSEKIIFLEPFGFSFSEPSRESQVVTDLVAGNVLELTGEKDDFYRVSYPNEKTGFIPKSEAQPYLEWLDSLDQSGENLAQTAKKLMGVPYLWGGTSPKGVDCSGFTKTIFFLNGMVIPRDASQQIMAGQEVDSDKNFQNLKSGDLLYFGRKATDSTPEKIVHVGMWIGDNKFIHSMGEVRISTFDPSAPDFDQYNYDRYLRTKRVLGRNDENVVQLNQSYLFTAPQAEPVRD